ncbi:MAG: outer membrane protein assembly factor BamB family protein [Candidatus Anammoxibacter sp.]
MKCIKLVNGLAFATLIAISLLISRSAFSETSNSVTPLKYVENRVIEKIQKPLDRINMVVKQIISANRSASSDSPVEIQTVEDLKWVFKADGATIVSPVVGPDDGTIYSLTIDIEMQLSVRNQELVIGELSSKLYALKPDLDFKFLLNQRLPRWIFRNIKGVAPFSPVILADGSIIVEAIDGDIDIETATLNNIEGRLFAIDKDGDNKWSGSGSSSFKDEIFVTPLVITNDDTIITTSVKIVDPANIDVEGLSGRITAIDPDAGNVKWSFNPVSNNNEPLVVIAPPVVDAVRGTIYVAAINLAKIRKLENIELGNFDLEAVKNSGTGFVTLIEEAISKILETIENSGNIGTVTGDIEQEMESFLSEFGGILGMTEIFALNQSSGVVEWQTSLPGVALNSVVLATDSVSAGAVNFKTDVEINVDLNVTFDESNPAETISFTFDVNLVGGDALELTIAGIVSTIGASNGDLLWSSSIDDSIFIKPVVSIDNNQIIVGASNPFIKNGLGKIDLNSDTISKMYAFNMADGSMEWESETFNGIIGFPILQGADGSLFLSLSDTATDSEGNVTLSSKLHSVNSDGSTKWSDPFVSDGSFTSSPVIRKENDSIFVGITSVVSKFVEIGSGSGGILGTFNIDEKNGIPLSSLVIDEERDVIYGVTTNVNLRLRTLSLKPSSFVHAIILD